MLERDVIKRTNDWAKKQGVQYIRAHYGRGAAVGWPDFIYLIPGGRPLFIEFKATGKRATRTQEWRIRILEELGYDVEVADSVDVAKEAITRALEAARVPA
jgi:hypothetical protein